MPTPHPLATLIAAQLPPDCPDDVLQARVESFTKKSLENALANPGRFISDELAAKHSAQFKCSVEESKIALTQPWMAGWIGANGSHDLQDVRHCLRTIEGKCAEQLMEWVERLCPDDYPALLDEMAATRKAWAKAQAAEFLADRPQWRALAPDLKDAIATEVGEAWHAGLHARIYADLCADYESDMAAENMTQGELYKWLLKQTPHVIARHWGNLNDVWHKKLVKQFSEAQLTAISNCYAQPTPEYAARLARASGKY